jgi:uncharacterized protein VirK/YbjX
MVIRNLFQSYRHDLATHRPDIATWRLARVLARFPLPNGTKELLGSPSAIAYQKLVGKNDPFFVLSNRHYLCKGLTKAQRVAIAQYTYSMIDKRLNPASKGALLEGGYALWSAEPTDHRFMIKLELGSDNLYEGGLSAVFYVNEQRVGVMSFAIADGSMIGTDPGPVVVIGRNQTTSDRWYQKPLQDAFKQIALPYMMLASVAGIAQALGNTKLYAICETAHPHALDAASAEVMKASYSAFWDKYKAVPQCNGIVMMNLPLESTPLDQVSSNHRRRAKGRREVMDNVFTDTAKSVAALLPNADNSPSANTNEPLGGAACAAALMTLTIGTDEVFARNQIAYKFGEHIDHSLLSKVLGLTGQFGTMFS